MRLTLGLPLLLLSVMSTDAAPAAERVRVVASPSLVESFADIDRLWQKSGHAPLDLVFGGPATLTATPGDLFAAESAGPIDALAQKGAIDPATRRELLANELVLVVPRGKRFPLQMQPGANLAGAFQGKLCTGDPVYARESLEKLGWWAPMQSRLVAHDDVRRTLAALERGECAAAVVYATDATANPRLEIVEGFPESTHRPIVYPFALQKGASPEAAAFFKFLRTSPEVAAALTVRGFWWMGP